MAALVPAAERAGGLEGLRIAVSEQPTTTTIAFAGEWDLAQRETTRHVVCRALARQPGRLVLDLGDLSFIDSSGVHVVTELAERAARLKIELAIVPGPKVVQRIFEICQLTERLPFANPA